MRNLCRSGACRFAALGAALLLLLPASDAKTKLRSHWLDREISIDGEIDEWRDTLVYVKAVDAFVALFNDDEALYLCLYSQDPENAKQFAIDGLRSRFQAKDAGEFTVYFPIGTGSPDPRDRGESAPVPVAAASGVIELELPGQRDRVTVTSGGETGIEAEVSLRGSFVYELKLPLVLDPARPWALGLFPGDTFKLLIENPRNDALADEQAFRDRRQGNPSRFDQGPFGPQSDPGWRDHPGSVDPVFGNRLAFVLKARVELATAPGK